MVSPWLPVETSPLMFRRNICGRSWKRARFSMNTIRRIRKRTERRSRKVGMVEKIRIDVLTLDSVQCAACGYMMESIAALPADVQELIDYREWSIKTREGVRKFTELKGKVLPTICIEGDLMFQSVIPQYEELIDALATHAPTETVRRRLQLLRDRGFDFERVKENLQQAGSGLKTQRDG